MPVGVVGDTMSDGAGLEPLALAELWLCDDLSGDDGRARRLADKLIEGIKAGRWPAEPMTRPGLPLFGIGAMGPKGARWSGAPSVETYYVIRPEDMRQAAAGLEAAFGGQMGPMSQRLREWGGLGAAPVRQMPTNAETIKAGDDAEWITREDANNRAAAAGLCDAGRDLFTNASRSRWLQPCLHADLTDKRINWTELEKILAEQAARQRASEQNKAAATPLRPKARRR